MSRLKMSVRLSGGPPWGFRLEGKTPEHPNLNVSKVRLKSKAYNIVKEGDFVICINGIPAKDMTFDQAMDMLDAPSLDLTLDLLRVKQISEGNVEGFLSETQQVDVKKTRKMQENEEICQEIQKNVILQNETVKTQPIKEMSKEIGDNVCESDESESDSECVSSDEDDTPHPHVSSVPEPKIQAQPKEPAQEQIQAQPKEPVQAQPKEPAQEQTQAQPKEPVQAQPKEPVLEQPKEPVQAQTQVQPKELVQAQPKETVQTQPLNRPVPVSESESEEEEESEYEEVEEEEDEKEEEKVQEKDLVEEEEEKEEEEEEEQEEEQEQEQEEEEEEEEQEETHGRQEGHVECAPPEPHVQHVPLSQERHSWMQTADAREGAGLGTRPSANPALANRLPTPFGARPAVVGGGGGGIQCQPPPTEDSSANLHRGHNGVGDELSAKREHQPEMEHDLHADLPMFKVAKVAARSQTWTPSTGYTRPSQLISTQQDVWKRIKSGSDVGPRPKSMPVDSLMEFYHSPEPEVRTGRAQSEEQDYTKVLNGHTFPPNSNLLKKLIQPPEDMEDLDLLLCKKKMFSSSSFYEEPKHIYPTVEEQVELCRKIANSLSSDTNQLSKGATMYNKRKKRADKWCFEGPDPSDNEGGMDYSSSPDISNSVQSTYRSTETHRKLKLVLDPRQLQDSNRLRHLGLYNEHNLISPDICFDLVKDLNSPTGKGAALFAKRKKKSEKWVVDETTVKKHEQQHERMEESLKNSLNSLYSQPPQSHLEAYEQMMSHRRLKLIKSPWEAALESPIGSCDAAFQEVRYQQKFPSALNGQLKPSAAPSPGPGLGLNLEPPPLPAFSLSASPISTDTSPPHLGSPNLGRFSAASSSEVYKPRVPKGWGGQTTDYSSTNWAQEAPVYSDVNSSLDGTPFSPNINFDLTQCKDFNNTARSFDQGGLCRAQSFRSVRPPSLIFS